jgi:phosphate-selective porin OprO and OprP
MRILPFVCLGLLFIWFAPVNLYSQTQTDTVPDGTEGETLVKNDAPKKPWNELDLGFTTFKYGMGFLYEYGSFDQDDAAKKQAELGDYKVETTFKVRDFRLLFSGQFPTKRTITWKTGFMYDGLSNQWFVRETGLMINVPELWGNIFMGRTKEGASLNKVMNGYAGWTMERQMALEAVPLLADGVKWLGWLPKQHVFWNAGAFADWTSEGQSFSTYRWQLVTRFGWLPLYKPEENTLVHLGTSTRYGEPDADKIRIRSRPEANTAPYFIDTGTFPSDHASTLGYEAYYSRGPLMIGSEYYVFKFHSPEMNDPAFNGGEAVVSYIFTGESRPYSTVSGIYSFVPVKKPVFKGGLGAIEGVVRYSSFDLNDGMIHGGKYKRITPMLNWYLSPLVRLEFAYGYGILDRYGLTGKTHFFQSRIQFTIL